MQGIASLVVVGAITVSVRRNKRSGVWHMTFALLLVSGMDDDGGGYKNIETLQAELIVQILCQTVDVGIHSLADR